MHPQEDLYGLVIAGGKSSRMGMDKAMLNYHGLPQQYYLYEMLKSMCSKVYISCNKSQAAQINKEYNIIEDLNTFNDIGPMAAILSAFHYHPEKNFVVVGCDYPFLTKNDLEGFISSIEETDKPKTFFNEKENLYEPMLGYYPHDLLPSLKEAYDAGNTSLQKILKINNAGKFSPLNITAIKSVDTEEDYQATRNMIG
ncbi:MAG: molybdenum cofactor guanylyltransferase [Ferruginibacter sp.]